ncbi:MAG: hypothetical protein ACXVRJ_13580 [Gaiellaceae bacterium]
MTVAAARLRLVVVGGLLVMAIGVGATPGEAALPGTAAKAHAAIAQERSAQRALGGRSYARSLAHVNAAVNDLLAVKSALADAARVATPIPQLDSIERLLDLAITDNDHAGSHLNEVLLLVGRGVPADSASIDQARSSLRQAVSASTALARILG